MGPTFPVLNSVVAVHRLREVSCLYGFTRLDAAPVAADGGLEEVFLAVEGAPLGSEADWLPAIEQFGEGIFLTFSGERVQTWLTKAEVRERVGRFREAYHRWAHGADHPRFPGGSYILLHSIAHILMEELSLDCGYPSTALKERIYALDTPNGGENRLAVLIYTAGSGIQGTLGGLVANAARIPELLERALERHALCSNDPLCADSAPATSRDGTMVNGATCHACLLAPETSCEFRNMLLDRAFLCPALGAADCALPFVNKQPDW